MSVFNEFRQAWEIQFPGEDLPGIWEDDTRANLEKHQQKLNQLRLEVKKEELYVKFLESALAEMEMRKPPLVTAPSENVRGINSLSSSPTAGELINGNREPGFMTLISVVNQESRLKEAAVADRLRVPLPKPVKQYSRSVLSDSPSKSKSDDVVAWTKQQIQQLQTKQFSKVDEVPNNTSNSVSPNYENIKHRPNHDVLHCKADYENVFDDISASR